MIENILVKLKENITEREAEILAWIIAAEGSIGLYKHKTQMAKLGFTLDVRIAISNTDYQFIEKTCKMLGTKNVYHEECEPTTNRKLCYYISIHKFEDVFFLLKKITKFLPIKNEQARLLREFCLLRLAKRRKSPYCKDELEIYEKLRKLNKRGLY